MRFSTFVLKNLMRRKTRSLLTVFGVAIAVSTTVSLLGISDAFQRSAVDGFDQRGVDLVVLEDGVIDQLSSELDERIIAQVRAMSGVKDVGAALLGLTAFEANGTTVTAMVQGWDPAGFLFDALTLREGRSLTREDRRTAVVGYQLARNLQKSSGDSLEIEGEEFTIVGIFESLVPAENSGAIVPLTEFQNVRLQEGQVTGFSVILSTRGDSDLVDQLQQQIDRLTDEKGRTLRLVVYKTQEYANQSSYLQVARSMTWLTSMIAIAVGAVGVLNTMIMSVVERIREISILCAIGWRKGRVVRMILSESLFLSLLGAVIGAALAVLLTSILLHMPAANGIVQEQISARILSIGIALAFIVGLIGGLYPAWLAARLMPSEGLRHE